MIIRIATRKSALALWQAEHVAEQLGHLAAVDAVELVPMSTRGDEILDRSLQKIGGKGLFIKELEIAMQEGRADIAVHSMKDVPAEMPDGFVLAAILERADPGDALVIRDGGSLEQLPQAALVGSSSLRRQAQLTALRPDLRVQPLRGNVNTRLKKLDDGEYDAIVLACAGLERLGFEQRITERFAPEQILPAAGQGAIGIECLAGRDDLAAVLGQIEHQQTLHAVSAERAVCKQLEASCQSPVASYAIVDGEELFLRALVATTDGSLILRAEARGPLQHAEATGIDVANSLLELGASDLLQSDAS